MADNIYGLRRCLLKRSPVEGVGLERIEWEWVEVVEEDLSNYRIGGDRASSMGVYGGAILVAQFLPVWENMKDFRRMYFSLDG